VRPGDEDGTPTGVDEELVAQIIPLRRRPETSPTQLLAEEPAEPEAAGRREWSVWDQATGELARPTRTRARSAAERRPWRWSARKACRLTLVLVLVACVLCVGVVALDAISAHPGGKPERSGVSLAGVHAAASGHDAALSSHGRSAQHSGVDRRAAHRLARQTGPRGRPAARRRGSVIPAEPSTEVLASSAAPVEQAASAPAPARATPAAAESQCVPGQLGC